jgi:predicted aspartyl protease
MGRIVASVTIESLFGSKKSMRCDALVDTGASHLTLPSAWKDRLGELETIRTVDLETATQSTVPGEVCGPVKIEVEGFKPVFGEVLFVNMEPDDGLYEPHLGYLPLESCQAAVDMLGHRLVHSEENGFEVGAGITYA